MLRLLSLYALGLTVSNSIAASTFPYPAAINCDSFSAGAWKGAHNTCNAEASDAKWSPILNRALPSWYQDMKLGIFVHWGVYSVPAYGTEWHWHSVECGGEANPTKAFDDRVYGINHDYRSFANDFKAELYNASAWVEVFKAAGASYVLPVAKHHDGFCMWNASTTAPGWNAVDVGPKRDVLQELYDAVEATKDFEFGIYFSQGEWFNPLMVADKATNWTKKTYVEQTMIPQRLDLVTRFPKSMVWHTDGGWFAPDSYWGNYEWLTYLYEKSPLAQRIVSCNSMGIGCSHCTGGGTSGEKSICLEYGDAPSGGDRTNAGRVLPHFFTNQMTIQRGSWSWDRSENGMASFFSTSELLLELVSTAAWNGTLIMNVGPTSDGLLPPIFEERLRGVGAWLGEGGNRKAVHATRPWNGGLPLGGESVGESGKNASSQPLNVFYTTPKEGIFATSERAVFATSFWWPPPPTCPAAAAVAGACDDAMAAPRVLALSLPNVGIKGTCTVTLLATGASVPCAKGASGIVLTLGGAPPMTGDAGVASLAWAFEIKGLA